MGLIGRSDVVPPPNNPPEWTGTPNPTWVAAVGGTYEMADDTFDPESDALTYTLNAGSTALPSFVTISGSTLVATTSVVEGTTTGVIIDVKDATSSLIASSAFSIVVSAALGTGVYVSKTGNDGNAGTEASPWLTIQYATDNASPGDTIYVRGGTYTERIVIGVSGTAGNYITLTNYPNETAIVDGTGLGIGTLITGSNISYYKIIGLEIANVVGGGIRFWADASYIEIRNCNIHDQTHSTGPEGHAIQIIAAGILEHGTPGYTDNHLIENVIIDGNTITDVITGTPGIFNECLTLAFDVKYFEITNNVIDNCSHIGIDCIGKTAWKSGAGSPAVSPHFPQYGRIANNTIKNSGFLSTLTNSMFHADGCKDIVVEDNLIYDCAGHGIDCNAEDSTFVNERMIYRRNRVLRTTPSGLLVGGAQVGTANGIRWAHNSVFLNDTTEAMWGMAGGSGADIVIKNNIIQSTDGGDGGFALNHYVNTTEALTLDYNLYHFSTSNYKYQGTTKFGATAFAQYQAFSGQDANGFTGDPLYVDPTTNDLTPDTGSPAINSGAALTTTNGAGTNSITLIVNDARWFHAGMGIAGLAGDTIRVGADTAVISSIHYNTDTITLASALTWSNGDGVSYPYSGASPDVGAIET